MDRRCISALLLLHAALATASSSNIPFSAASVISDRKSFPNPRKSSPGIARLAPEIARAACIPEMTAASMHSVLKPVSIQVPAR